MQIYRISTESNEKYKYSQKGNKLNTFLYYNRMASLLNYLFIYLLEYDLVMWLVEFTQ